MTMLDRLVAREVASLFGTDETGCGCSACRAEAASPARRQTRGGTGGSAMPAWQGWSTPVTLAQIRQAQQDARTGKAVPLRLRPFLSTGEPHIYRITRAGIDRDRPLTIGMTQDTRSIAQRVGEHRGSKRGDQQVRAAIANLHPGQILVQAGRMRGHPDIRQTHGYEIWLQGRERPRIYEPDTRTFDERDY